MPRGPDGCLDRGALRKGKNNPHPTHVKVGPGGAAVNIPHVKVVHIPLKKAVVCRYMK